MSTNNIIAQLERKIEELEEEVIELKSKLSMQQGRKHSKKELRELYEWNEQDVLFSNTVMNFTKCRRLLRKMMLNERAREL